jgi:phosphoribosyl 1,2-cyclic phosphodiesterase
MRFSVLASGSKANCTVVATEQTKILIDCGLSGRECVRRLEAVGFSMDQVTAIVVTHAHSDHINGVSVLSRRYGVPVYATSATIAQLGSCHQTFELDVGGLEVIDDLSIQSFHLPHDSQDTIGLLVSDGERRLAHITDCGSVTALVKAFVREVEGIVLEFNHDVSMLHESSYPWSVKQRISSNYGHLSNEAAARFLGQMCHETLEVVVLAHLSQESNCPNLAMDTARDALGEQASVMLTYARPDSPTEVFELRGASGLVTKLPRAI